jgi:hypothetical protein
MLPERKWGLPTALAKRSTREVQYKEGYRCRVFCVNCGKKGGMVTKEAFEHVFYLCELCAGTYGELPMVPVPDEWVL